MPKAKQDEFLEEAQEAIEAIAPSPITADFGREDLNALRDAVNYLLSK